MEGLSSALHRSDLPIIAEIDSYTAYKMIQQIDVDRSPYSSLIRDIRRNLYFREACVTHINRSQNKVSDSLASFGRIEGRTMTWI